MASCRYDTTFCQLFKMILPNTDIDNIEVIELFKPDNGVTRVKLHVALVNGETRETEFSASNSVSGDAELGEFNKPFSDIKSVDFQPSGVTAILTLQDESLLEADADSLGIIHYVIVRGFPVKNNETTILFKNMQMVEISEYDLTITLLDGTILVEKLGGATPSSPLIGHARFNDFSFQIREVKRIYFQQ